MGDEAAFTSLRPLGHEQIVAATLNASAPLASIPAGATLAYITVGPTATSVRFRADGIAPTAGVGLRVLADKDPLLLQGDLSQYRFIKEVGAPLLDVEYFTAS